MKNEAWSALGIENSDIHGLLIAIAELFAGALEIVTRQRKWVERIDLFSPFSVQE